MASPARVRPLLMAFLKAPRCGYVKTRLGRQVGHQQATRIYRAMAERQLRNVPAPFRVEVHYAPRGARAEMRDWLGANYRYCVQSGGDLGQRLARAFARGFRRGGTEIIAIGADCPGLDGNCLTEAARRLRKSDVVLGPAADGGYYLIGLRRPAPHLFAGIAWSSKSVLQQTLDRIAASGLSSELLAVKEDVDDLESLRRHRALLRQRLDGEETLLPPVSSGHARPIYAPRHSP